MNRTHSIGIMQGRLVPSRGRGTQFFPFGEWKKEFVDAAGIGIDEIDFIFDMDRHEENPLWTEHGIQEVQKVIAESGVKVLHVCADIFMRRPFFRVSEQERKENVEILKKLLGAAKQIGAINIEIPLVDNSSMKTREEKELLVHSLQECLPKAKELGITISLETDLPPKELLDFVKEFADPFVKIIYDSGNSSSLGYNAYEEVSTYGEYISNVHVKDRPLGKKTVPLGMGDANFEGLFRALKEKGYTGGFTLQAARQEDGNEKEAILSYVDFIKKHESV